MARVRFVLFIDGEKEEIKANMAIEDIIKLQKILGVDKDNYELYVEDVEGKTITLAFKDKFDIKRWTKTICSFIARKILKRRRKNEINY